MDKAEKITIEIERVRKLAFDSRKVVAVLDAFCPKAHRLKMELEDYIDNLERIISEDKESL